MCEDQKYINRKDIEERALLKFKDYLVYSKRMSQYLAENDKEPTWDGHIYLYNCAHKVKAHQIGRIPVQVKGTEVVRFKRTKFKFSIDTVGLKAFLLEPTVYVVCQEKKGSMDRELYYRFLLPETVKKILSGHKGQASVSVLMKPLPDSDTFAEKLQMFLTDKTKQLGFAHKQSPSMQAVLKRGLPLQLSTPKKFPDIAHLYGYLSQNETFLYAKNDEEFGTVVPVDGGPFRFSFSKHEEEKIKVGDRIFFDVYTHEIKNGRDYIIAGDGMLTIDLPISEKDETPVKLSITCPSSYLDDFVKHGELVMALKEHRIITIGDCDIDIGNNGIEGDIVQLEKNLSVWKVLQETLEKMHVKRRLEVDKISADDERALSLIIDCVHDGKLISLDNPPEPGVYVFEIANLNLLLYLAKATPSKFYIGDIFDSGVKFKVSVDDGSTWTPTCVFSYLRDELLWQVCDNIDFSAIEKSYESIQPKEDGFVKVVEDDLGYIALSINELGQNQAGSSRESELRDAYTRLENWLSEYKETLKSLE